MQDMITIKLPAHAVRFLRQMLKEKRTELARMDDTQQYTLQHDAAFDSLNELESALPDE